MMVPLHLQVSAALDEEWWRRCKHVNKGEATSLAHLNYSMQGTAISNAYLGKA